MIFEKALTTPYVVWRQAFTHFNALASVCVIDTGLNGAGSSWACKNCQWSPPTSNFVKLNFYGSRDHRGVAGGGFILRSSDSILAAGAFHLGVVSINVAEMSAC